MYVYEEDCSSTGVMKIGDCLVLGDCLVVVGYRELCSRLSMEGMQEPKCTAEANYTEKAKYTEKANFSRKVIFRYTEQN